MIWGIHLGLWSFKPWRVRGGAASTGACDWCLALARLVAIRSRGAVGSVADGLRAWLCGGCHGAYRRALLHRARGGVSVARTLREVVQGAARVVIEWHRRATLLRVQYGGKRVAISLSPAECREVARGLLMGCILTEVEWVGGPDGREALGRG